jgi:predicted RNase H-like HicB family nuclease
VACGDTIKEVRKLIREAVKLHMHSLRKHGEPVPKPAARIFIIRAA